MDELDYLGGSRAFRGVSQLVAPDRLLSHSCGPASSDLRHICRLQDYPGRMNFRSLRQADKLQGGEKLPKGENMHDRAIKDNQHHSHRERMQAYI